MKPLDAPTTADPATARLRIGLVTPAWPGTGTPNGMATAVAHLAAGLEALGHEVTIIAHHVDGPHDHPRLVELPKLPMPLVHRLLFRAFPQHIVRQSVIRSLAAAARQAIERHGIQVLMTDENRGWAGPVRRRLPIPVVVTLHGPEWLHRATPGAQKTRSSALWERWEASGLRGVDGIIAPSRDVRDRTDKEWGLPDLPCAVIGNPVDPGPLTAVAAQTADPRLLFIGRFDWIKGGDVVIEAFAKIAAAHPVCRLTFVGPDIGIEQANGPRLTLPLALSRLPEATRARIDILGPKTRDEIVQLRKAHPVAIMASRYETFGVALIEAMVAGAAVVSTRVGGCSEIVKDGETGLLVPPDDPDALATACLRLLNDPALAVRLGAAARADASARFAPEVVAQDVARFLAPICGR
jgi:glycosyltransferase involved in cell wall biosynthesis